MKILFHICCGICAFYPVKLLQKEFQEVILYFYNPNIQPEEEYQKRLKAAQKVARILKTKLIVGPYQPKKWFEFVKGYEDEPEGGKRCSLCFRFRLEKTAQSAKKKEIDWFSTSLTVSPYKNAMIINQIGQEIAQKHKIRFLVRDFKKQDGFKKTMELAKKYHLYHQNYCGCVFSK